MIPIASIYIPVAEYHRDIAHRAVQSAQLQTVPVKIFARECVGTPATFRNLALKADTPFVIFLDADDVLDKTFVEATLQAYVEGQYVYTNWYEGDFQRMPRECAWQDDSHHIVTTLYPTAVFKALGGFDETLPGHEDADFYIRSYSRGFCGVHLKQPLVSRPDDMGRRSKQFNARSDYSQYLMRTVEKYGGLAKVMACCGQGNFPAQNSGSEEQPGDVLVTALWQGTSIEAGRATGRKYIAGNHSQLRIAKEDLDLAPDRFKIVEDLRSLAPNKEISLRDAGLL